MPSQNVLRLTSYCFQYLLTQNGYQGQKRNIVDDAKFETKVNEEEKRNWINLVRRKSQGIQKIDFFIYTQSNVKHG